MDQETRAMDIRPVEICCLNLTFLLPTAMSLQDAAWVNGWPPHVWFPPWSKEVVVWWWFAGDSVSDLLRIQGTLKQHGDHSILQQYPIPSGLRQCGTICLSMGKWPNTPPGCVRAIWPKRRVMEFCIRWLGLHNHPTSTQLRWFGMSWTAEWKKSSQRVLNSFKTVGKAIQDYAGWENAKSVQSCHQGKGWLLWRI